MEKGSAASYVPGLSDEADQLVRREADLRNMSIINILREGIEQHWFGRVEHLQELEERRNRAKAAVAQG